MHSPSERRREGRRLPRDRARHGFQDNFLPSTREANICAIFNARLNVTSAPEKWSVDVNTSFLFLFVEILGKEGREKETEAIYQSV